PGAQIFAVGGQCEPAWAPPLLDLLGDRPRVPHGADGRIVDTRDVNLIQSVFFGHVVFLAFRPGVSCGSSTNRWSSRRHRGDRVAPPTSRGTGRSTRPRAPTPAARADTDAVDLRDCVR